MRDDPARLFGCLGTGFAMRRDVLASYAALEHLGGVYVELYLPTVVHHLGHRVEDMDRHGDLYHHVRAAPPYTVAEAQALARGGALVVHPLKDADGLQTPPAPA